MPIGWRAERPKMWRTTSFRRYFSRCTPGSTNFSRATAFVLGCSRSPAVAHHYRRRPDAILEAPEPGSDVDEGRLAQRRRALGQWLHASIDKLVPRIRRC